jgi:hypothetical protein
MFSLYRGLLQRVGNTVAQHNVLPMPQQRQQYQSQKGLAAAPARTVTVTVSAMATCMRVESALNRHLYTHSTNRIRPSRRHRHRHRHRHRLTQVTQLTQLTQVTQVAHLHSIAAAPFIEVPRQVNVIGAPISLGQPLAGVETGPDSLRNAGLVDIIANVSYIVNAMICLSLSLSVFASDT